MPAGNFTGEGMVLSTMATFSCNPRICLHNAVDCEHYNDCLQSNNAVERGLEKG